MKERASPSTTTGPPQVSPIVVAGMHRSGTSYLASILAAGGVAMGTRLVAADANNPRGYFEDVEFLAVNQRLMLCCTEDSAGHRDWGWTETEAWNEGPAAALKGSARELLAAHDRGDHQGPWGWKDPRTTLALDFWDESIQDTGLTPGYLLVYRAPWDVADAMQRTGAEVFLSNPEYGYRIWTFYNRRLLDFRRRHRERSLLVSIAAVLAEPHRFADLLAARFGLELEQDLPARLRGQEGLRALPLDHPLIELVAATSPDVFGLYGELQEAADLPAAGLVLERRSTRMRSKPVSPRLSVVIPCRDHGELLVEAVASVQAAASDSELIVVNDGSRQPRTLEVLGRLRQAGYDVLDEVGVGLAQARNAGIARAQAPYILTLDADDRLRPQFVEAAVALLDEAPRLGVVYGNRHTFGLRAADIEVADFDLDRMLCGNYVASCAVFRKAAWSSCGGYARELAAWEDWEFWIALAEQGWDFHHLPMLSFDHRLRPQSMVANCERREFSLPLQEFIVRKHERLYLSRLPHLLVAIQDRAAAEAERRTANELLAAERERLLYRELGGWQDRVRFMEGTLAWRSRAWLLRLLGRLGRGAARRVG